MEKMPVDCFRPSPGSLCGLDVDAPEVVCPGSPFSRALSPPGRTQLVVDMAEECLTFPAPPALDGIKSRSQDVLRASGAGLAFPADAVRPAVVGGRGAEARGSVQGQNPVLQGAAASRKEEEWMQIKLLEKRIKDAKTRTVSDRELGEIDGELTVLREILLDDIKLQDPACEDPQYPMSGLGHVIDEQLSELLLEEFGADLPNFRRTQREFGLKLSLLVERNTEAKGDELELELLGFLAYKTWGPPAPCVSIGAVGVSDRRRGKGYGRQLMKVAEDRAALLGCQGPHGFVPGEVRLRSLATAVHFYERLGYARVTPEEQSAGGPPPERTPGCPDPERPVREEVAGDNGHDDDDEAPCVPMVRRCAPFSPRTAATLAPLLSPTQQPWSPKQARALEDGPTWPPIAVFLLPESSLVSF
eukprot:CAMPEP_0203907840 /NCGR_PEP_ID=MMETSP0359-20131031/49292_1 /ASSEMBLY_ACC=CAM_ASM_000338 /TAXON_ID=268821 /ORGANISM="Scrippsiella Hangoei, Strain SHTV-5" /LENGTH=415 /DNA_ID=CAMNT_0050832711 /DNA_START=15 /DNA_END=1262 /DNA_ORIENTATION=-